MKRYPQKYAPVASRGALSDTTYQHRAIASRAIGRPLPKRAEVHHVDGNKQNNANSNLVICEDRGYHMLLHQRTRILRAGGNPNTDRWCRGCSRCVSVDKFYVSKRDGHQALCQDCQKATAA